MNNTDIYVQKYKDLKESLFVPCGKSQSNDLLFRAIDEGVIDPEDILVSIAQLYKQNKEVLKDGALTFASSFLTGKEHQLYPCLDKSGKFCMLHYGEDEWNRAKYVFWAMNVDKAIEISESFEKESDEEYHPDIWDQERFNLSSAQERYEHYDEICKEYVHEYIPVNWRRLEQLTDSDSLTLDSLLLHRYQIFHSKYPELKEVSMVYIEFISDDVWIPYIYTNIDYSLKPQPLFATLKQLLDYSDIFYIENLQIK